MSDKVQQEAIKELLKEAIEVNKNLTSIEKQMAKDNIDRAAQQADWIVEMLRMCGYLK